MTEISCCGIVCSDCPEYRCNCQGCRACAGNPPWLGDAGLDICPLYRCAIVDRNLKDCGECPELPCEIFLGLKDPAMNEDEFNKSVGDRVSLLRTLHYA